MGALAALAASQAGTLGLGFSGGGFIIPFFLGVIDVLQRQLGVIKPNMPMAGGSSGALALMAANGLVPLDTMRSEVDRLSSYCLAHGNCYGMLAAEVKQAAERLVPPNAANWTNQQRNTHIAVTYPSKLGQSPAMQKLVSNFTSKEDLIKALEASIYIPYYAGPKLCTIFRGEPAYDGTFAGPGEGFLPCPPNVSYCIRVSSLPANEMLGPLFTNLIRGNREDLRRALDVAANTILGTNLTAQVEKIRTAYAAIDRQAARIELAQASMLVDALTHMKTPGEGMADIYPGRRHPLPVSKLYWMTFMMAPGSPDQIDMLYKLGQAEAMSWAEENGFVKGKKPPPRGILGGRGFFFRSFEADSNSGSGVPANGGAREAEQPVEIAAAVDGAPAPAPAAAPTDKSDKEKGTPLFTWLLG